MKTVLITGASDGIGKATAIKLNELGYKLFLFGRTKEKLDEVARLENVVKSYCFDAHNRQDLINALDDINNNGGVDILINNMGANLGKQEVKDIDVDIFEQMLDINCISHLICIQKVLPNMIEKGHGNIVNILSSCCKYDNPTIGAYTASKKAMEALSDTLRKEVKDKGIVVTAIYPGGVDTNFRTINRDDYLRA
ncbi:MAG: SDR family oxidoreductase, partial [Firmicutes bacterium]|nr:SDR family oxidoreductase [Candidatus Colivicinus equi]